jgi:hypothetical protein
MGVGGGGVSNEPWCSRSYVDRAALLVMNQGSPSLDPAQAGATHTRLPF